MSTFENHWENTADSEIPANKLKQASEFLKPVMNRVLDNNNQIIKILDAGCGDGVHLKVIFDEYSKLHDMHCTAIDLAGSAIKKVKSKFPDSFLSTKVADIQDLSCFNEKFDVVISYGVVAYAESPRKAIGELVKVLNKNGVLAIWIYPVNSVIKISLFRMARLICKMAGHRGTSAICHMLVPFMHLLPVTSKISLLNSSWKACHEVLMVNLDPELLSLLTKKKVQKWLVEEGCRMIGVNHSMPGAIYASR